MGSPIHRWAHPRTLHLLAYVFFDPIWSGLVGHTPTPTPFWLRSLSCWRPSRANFHAHEFVRSIFRARVFNFSVLALIALGNYTKFEEWKYHDSPCCALFCFHFQPVNFLGPKKESKKHGERITGGHVTAQNACTSRSCPLDGLMESKVKGTRLRPARRPVWEAR